MSIEDYNAMNVAALKDALRERSLPTSGKKAELVKRLEDADKSDGATAEVAKDGESGAKEGASLADTVAPESAGAEKDAPPETSDADASEDVVAKRVERFGSAVLGEDEKAKLREVRFKASDPAVDPGTLEERAARFGIETDESKKKKEAARAKRFQLDTPEILADKKRAREERFKKPVSETKQVPLEELAALIKKRT